VHFTIRDPGASDETVVEEVRITAQNMCVNQQQEKPEPIHQDED
jgi:hypothetical protein